MASLSNSVRRVRYSIMDQPLLNTLHSHLIAYPTPSNLNASWNWGSLAGLCLVLQIVTGVCLAMHYTAHVDRAFASVQHIMRDVPSGWLLRYFHANGASFFFIVVYIHLFRGLYYNSYAQPRELVWLFGVVIRLLMIRTAFIGYVLPWGELLCPRGLSQYSCFLPVFGFPFSQNQKPKQSLVKARIKSSERIGPHNIDILSILVGSLLGDGWGEKRSNSTRFHIHCSAKNVEYILWLHKYLAERDYCSTVKPKITKQIGQNGKIYYSIKIRTWSFTSLNYIYDSFYLEKVKVVPSLEFLNQFCTPLALAIWFMDDGSKHAAGGVLLHTNSFTFKEIQTLQKLLLEKYGLKSSYTKKPSLNLDRGYIIYISKEYLSLFISIVKPYMVSSMYYKLGLIKKQK